jgi:hypothetical protein
MVHLMKNDSHGEHIGHRVEILWDQYRFGAQKTDQKYPVTLVKLSVHFQTNSMRLCARSCSS